MSEAPSVRIPAAIEKAEAAFAKWSVHIPSQLTAPNGEVVTATEVALAKALWEYAFERHANCDTSCQSAVPAPALIAFTEKVESL